MWEKMREGIKGKKGLKNTVGVYIDVFRVLNFEKS